MDYEKELEIILRKDVVTNKDKGGYLIINPKSLNQESLYELEKEIKKLK